MQTSQTQSWICGVCGYVHQGDTPPDYCPVCGATSDMFEPYQKPEKDSKKPTNQWRCLNCEYIHDGAHPPEFCPVCGAKAERFEPFELSAAAPESSVQKQKVVVVGAGIAGLSAVEAVRNISPSAEIILFSKEQDLPYFRLNLTRYLAGEVKKDELKLHPKEWYEEKKIDLLMKKELINIDLEKKELEFQDNSRTSFDKLILSVGSHPFVPPFPGSNKEKVTVLRTITNADYILDAAQKGLDCVCIGGGLLGLETAGGLARKGVKVTLLEGHGWVLPRQLNQKAGSILKSQISSLGITLKEKSRVREITGDERVRSVILEDGSVIPAELVVITTGIRPNSYLARLAGLEVNQGIIVDDLLKTSKPEIFAAGDVAEHRGVTYGTWGPSQFQGTISGLNASDSRAEFVGIPRSNMLKVLGYDLFSIGLNQIDDASYQKVDAEIDDQYFCFIFRDNHLVGAILLGDTSLSAVIKNLIEKKMDCTEVLKLKPEVKDIISFLKGQT